MKTIRMWWEGTKLTLKFMVTITHFKCILLAYRIIANLVLHGITLMKKLEERKIRTEARAYKHGDDLGELGKEDST